MLILITEPNHIHCDRIGWVTMSKYGFLTVILHTCETKTFVHISNVTKVGKNVFGEIEDGDDSMKENDDEPTYETDYPPGDKNHVDKNGITFG